MPLSRREARELMSRGYEMGTVVLNGIVQRRGDGTLAVDGQPVEDWLGSLEGKEVVVVTAEVTEAHGKKRTCPTCGTEFEGYDCPRCREIRHRLRGR